MSTAELPTPQTRLVTAEQLFREYSHVHCDLIEGRVYEMAPPGFGHGSIEGTLSAKLWNHVVKNDLGLVVTGETGFIVERNPDTVLGADVAFVRKDRITAVGVTEQYFPEAPTIAVEIVSPSDVAEQVNDKALRWLAAGTKLVWIVYPKNKTVTVYPSTDNVKLLSAEDALDGADVLPGFSVKVAELFAGLK